MARGGSLSFAQRVLAWQRKAGRQGLPWQGTRDPYRIWLSEIMLQQTQVATVLPYYAAFLRAFPTVAALAEAPQEQVMSLWSGLGYYSRARNLHRCAQLVVSEHGGQFPRQRRALEQLPGIGRSTAAAIAAFAWGEREAILDGNVKRVLCRYALIEGVPDASATLKSLWLLAESLLPKRHIEAYTQGMMDLGATVCVRRAPLCAQCPLRDSCQAFAQGRQDELPTRRARRPLPQREVTMLLAHRRVGAQSLVWLPVRPSPGIWGGLRSLPERALRVESEHDRDHGFWQQWLSELGLFLPVQADSGARGQFRATVLPVIDHVFSHFRLRIHPRLIDVPDEPCWYVDDAARVSGDHWVSLDDLDGAALPAPVRRLLVDFRDRLAGSSTSC